MQVPEQWFTHVTCSSSHRHLAVTELSLGYRVTPTQGEEVFGYTIRVTVALFTQRIIEPLRSTVAAFFTDKIFFTVANTIIITRHPIRPQAVTVTS